MTIKACRFAVAASAVCWLAFFPVHGNAKEVTGSEVVQHCDLDKTPGKDMLSTLTVILRDADGAEKKTIYRRYWKAAGGKHGLQDKMLIFTQYPADQKGTAFMSWNYVPKQHKAPEQWLYLPSLNSIRRVSVRDPADSFLTSDMSYWDISDRPLDADTHTLLRTEEQDGKNYYVVESVPKEEGAPYSKRIQWFREGSNGWDDCLKSRIEYYNPAGTLAKTQSLDWQNVDGVWVWKEVVVKNAKTSHTSTFQVSDVTLNSGLKDRIFTERTMRHGVR